MPILQRNCLICGAPFSAARYAVSQGYAKYCSRPCAQDARRRPLADRFWEKVDRRGPDECWNWTGHVSTGRMPYGQFRISKQKQSLAHRVSFALQAGQFPLPGVVVMHTCDNPRCVNPAHLRLGTYADNMADMVAKGRAATGSRNANSQAGVREKKSGERNGLAKLNPELVREIRRLADEQYTIAAIARHFGLTWNAIAAVVRRQTWRHVE